MYIEIKHKVKINTPKGISVITIDICLDNLKRLNVVMNFLTDKNSPDLFGFALIRLLLIYDIRIRFSCSKADLRCKRYLCIKYIVLTSA